MKNYKNCPVCGNTSFNNFLKCKDNTGSNETFQMDQCNACEFVFTNPIPLESEIGKYYESDEYISHSNTSKGLTNTLYQTVRNYTLKQKIALIKSLGSGKNILDIGSGTGEFLNSCKQAGFNVSGIEPSPAARKLAEDNFSLQLKEEVELDKLAGESQDFISMWHVLEHVYHLNDRIEQIKRLLKPDGKVIIAVPNRNSYDANYYKENWAAYDLPRHLYHFRPIDIEKVFSKHGFKLDKILPMKFDSFYVSMLSEKYKNGTVNYFQAFKTGLKSNRKAGDKPKYSSQIYILSKN